MGPTTNLTVTTGDLHFDHSTYDITLRRSSDDLPSLGFGLYHSVDVGNLPAAGYTTTTTSPLRHASRRSPHLRAPLCSLFDGVNYVSSRRSHRLPHLIILINRSRARSVPLLPSPLPALTAFWHNHSVPTHPTRGPFPNSCHIPSHTHTNTPHQHMQHTARPRNKRNPTLDPRNPSIRSKRIHHIFLSSSSPLPLILIHSKILYPSRFHNRPGPSFLPSLRLAISYAPLTLPLSARPALEFFYVGSSRTRTRSTQAFDILLYPSIELHSNKSQRPSTSTHLDSLAATTKPIRATFLRSFSRPLLLRLDPYPIHNDTPRRQLNNLVE